MDARRLLLSLVLILLLAALPGCSGSGSSGFDVSPGAEDSAIDQALQEQHCVDVGGLTICPADQGPQPAPTATPTTAPPATATVAATATAAAPTASPTATATAPAMSATATAAPEQSPIEPAATATATATAQAITTASATNTRSPTPTPTATNTPGMKITFFVDASPTLSCTALDATTCRFTISFLAQGFPLDAVFRAAARSVDPAGPWTIGPPAAASGPQPSDGLVAPVSVSGVSSAPAQSREVQIVVLVYLQPPGLVPDQAELLGESGASLAYVASPLTVIAAP